MSEPETKPVLRLFVWPRFAPDYKDGLAFAIAETVQEAQGLVVEDSGVWPGDWGPCEEYPITTRIGFARHGGQ